MAGIGGQDCFASLFLVRHLHCILYWQSVLSWAINWGRYLLAVQSGDIMSNCNEVFSSLDVTVARGSGRSRGTSVDTDDAAGSSVRTRTGSVGSAGVPRADALTDNTIDPRSLPDGQCPTIDEMTQAAAFLAKMVTCLLYTSPSPRD